MDQTTFSKFQKLIYDESGIDLSEDKMVLLTNRIKKRLRQLNLQSPSEYLKIIELDVDGRELVNLLDAVSTNLTYFFREPSHFNLLTQIFQEWTRESRSKARIWCAAASTGEEPYTLTMLANEHLNLSSCDFKLLATDICIPVLHQAQHGVYGETQLKRVPQELRDKYFEKINSQEEQQWSCKQALREPILFKRLNLAQLPLPLQGPLDAIFCRNVMIYFDIVLRSKLISEFSNLLAPGGYLFIGQSENLLGIEHSLKKVDVSVYQKPKS